MEQRRDTIRFFVLERSSVPSGRETVGGGRREGQPGERTRVGSENGGGARLKNTEEVECNEAWRWMREKKGVILKISGRVFPSGLR